MNQRAVIIVQYGGLPINPYECPKQSYDIVQVPVLSDQASSALELLISSRATERVDVSRISIPGSGASHAHHRLRLGIVLERASGITHDGRHMDRRPLGLVIAHTGHIGTVGQDFGGVLLVLCVLDQLLVLTRATLADAAERKDSSH